MRALLLGLMLAVLAAPCWAQDEEESPVDTAYDACSEQAQTTLDMQGCYDRAVTGWQGLLDEALGDIRGSCNARDVEFVAASQGIWQAYYDNEIAFHLETYDGSVAPLYALGRAYEVLQQRTLLLRDFRDICRSRADQ